MHYIVVLFILIFTSGCVTNKITVDLEKVNRDTTLNVKVGEDIVISVYENLSTGAMWYLDGLNGSVELVKEDYEKVKHIKGLTGRGGTKNYFFKAKEVGSCNLIFNYKRGWEPHPGTIKSVHFTIN